MPLPTWAQSGPALIICLFFIVFLRAQGTYWLSRGVSVGVMKGQDRQGIIGSIAKWFAGPIPKKGAGLLEKWGIVIIPLCFLTVGLQTAVLAGAGLVRMRWIRFTLAMLPGAIAWAFLYGLGMLAIWMAAVEAIAGNPWSWVILATVIVLGGIFTMWKKKQSRRFLSPADEKPTITVSDVSHNRTE